MTRTLQATKLSLAIWRCNVPMQAFAPRQLKVLTSVSQASS